MRPAQSVSLGPHANPIVDSGEFDRRQIVHHAVRIGLLGPDRVAQRCIELAAGPCKATPL